MTAVPSFDDLVFGAVALVVFVGLACGAHIVLGRLRSLLRLGLQSWVDMVVSMVFTVILLWTLLMSTNHRATVSFVALLALPVWLAGLLFLGVGVFEAPRRAGSGERRDRLVIGLGLVASAVVIVYLSVEPPSGLFSDAAMSVSNAPGP